MIFIKLNKKYFWLKWNFYSNLILYSVGILMTILKKNNKLVVQNIVIIVLITSWNNKKKNHTALAFNTYRQH